MTANIEFSVPYSQRYLVLGLVGLVGSVGLGLPLLLRLGLVGLALWLVLGIALNNYRCEYSTLRPKTQCSPHDYLHVTGLHNLLAVTHKCSCNNCDNVYILYWQVINVSNRCSWQNRPNGSRVVMLHRHFAV